MYREGMTLVVPQQHAQVIHSFLTPGDPDPYAITYGVKITNPPVVALTENDLAEQLDNIFQTNLQAQISAPIGVAQTEIFWQQGAVGEPPAVGTYAGGWGGGNAGATSILPQNSAFLLHKRTNRAGRTGRGRLYLPGVPEGSVDNVGNVSPGTVTGLNTALASWVADILNASDFEYMCLFHDSLGSAALVVPTPIASITCDPVIGTQRRRLRR